MARTNRPDPMERLIRRGLQNGIQTMSGRANSSKTLTEAAQPRDITYLGDRQAFLSILQYDAAQLDRSFDQGERAEVFAAMVDRIAADLGMDGGAV